MEADEDAPPLGTRVRLHDDDDIPATWGTVVDPDAAELAERLPDDLPTVSVRWPSGYRRNEYVEDLRWEKT